MLRKEKSGGPAKVPVRRDADDLSVLAPLCYRERKVCRAAQAPVARGEAMGRDEARDIRRFGWASAAFAKLVALAARVGADPLESSDAALQRLVMVLLAVGTLPLTILWSVVYLRRRSAARRRGARGLFARHADQYGAVRLDPQLPPLPLHPASHDPCAALACHDEPWRLQEFERGDHLGGALSGRLASGRGSAPDCAVDRGLRPAPDRERGSRAFAQASRAAGGVRHLVLRLEPRQRDRHRLRAALLFRRAAKLLSGTVRDADPQHPAEGNLGRA